MPNAREAKVGRSKARDYLVNPGHPDGGPKARRFEEVLGYTRADHELLCLDIRAAVVDGEVVNWRLRPDGAVTWTVMLSITGPNGRTAKVRSDWHVKRIGSLPVLSTARIEKSESSRRH